MPTKKQTSKHIYLVKYSAFMNRIIWGGGEKCLPQIMDGFTVDTSSPDSLPYHQVRKQVVALSVDTGS